MALRIDKINLKATDVAALPVYGLITTGTNLNTLDGRVYGKYWQSENANSPTSLNYPVAAAGTLLVLKNNASNLATSCTQIYLPYNSNEIYSRSFYNSWTAWSRFASIDMDGANSTIKSLTGLTTALSIEQGGTGVVSKEAFRQSYNVPTKDESLLTKNNLSDLADRAAAWLNVRPIGPTPLAGDPVNDYDAVTKRWVENRVDTDISTLKSDVGNLKTRQIVNTDWTAQRPQNQQYDSSFNVGTGYKLISQGTDIDGKTYAASLEMVRSRSDGIINARINVVDAAGHSIFYDFNNNGEIVVPPKQNISTRRFRIANDGTSSMDGRLNMWGVSTRPDVFEYGWSNGYGFYMQRNTDNSKELCVNGTITAHNVSAGSDRDLKTDIETIANATEKLRKMYGYTYILKSDGMPYAGVIAQ